MFFSELEIPPKDVHMVKPNIAILWAHEDLLGRAVQQLLSRAKDWKIIRIYDESDTDLLAREADKINPDTIIVHQGDYTGNIMDTLKKLMTEHAQMKLLIISLENNLVEVYNKQTVLIKEASDLLSVIEKHPHPNEQEVMHKPQSNSPISSFQ